MEREKVMIIADELRNIVAPLQRNFFEKSYSVYGNLSALQCNILTALSASGKLCPTDLARYLCTSNQRLTRPLAGLIAKGLVEKTKSANNQKTVYVSITKNGQDIEDAVHSYLTKNLGFLLSFVSEEDAEAFYDALLTMRRVIDKFDSK
ncbi:MAG: MarR family transcriptional regulator [Clostridia bacterium]|nr:MarR family transcriptional regulator [Clostridia bacterium]